MLARLIRHAILGAEGDVKMNELFAVGQILGYITIITGITMAILIMSSLI